MNRREAIKAGAGLVAAAAAGGVECRQSTGARIAHEPEAEVFGWLVDDEGEAFANTLNFWIAERLPNIWEKARSAARAGKKVAMSATANFGVIERLDPAENIMRRKVDGSEIYTIALEIPPDPIPPGWSPTEEDEN